MTLKPAEDNLPQSDRPGTELQTATKGEDHLLDHGLPPVKAPLPMQKRAILVRGDLVIKIQEPGASRRERLRTLAGREVGQQTGLFVVPEIVSFDDSRGEIVFQRLRLTTGLRPALSESGQSMELVSRAAEALAAIHGQMKSSEGAIRISSSEMGISPGRELVPLHGDFGMRNIFCLPDTDGIALIDWANADWIGLDADLGPPEIDLAVFLLSFFNRRVFGPWPVSRRHEVARHFLATYASASPNGLDLDTLRAIVAVLTPGFTQKIRRRKGRLYTLSCRHAMIDLGLFLRRLSRRDFVSRGRGERHKGRHMEHSSSTMRYTDSHKGKGRDYHETFSPEVNRYRAMVWRLEQRALNGIVRDHLVSGKIAHLDFACGTGRVLGHLLGHVSSATGVDVSVSMMEVARKVAPGAELIEADLTQRDVLGERSFDLITAFRFFPNAEPELRRAVFLVLARHLAPHGVLVFNNHKNRNSLRQRISRLLGREVVRGMTHADVEALVAQAGLRILEVIPLGNLPASEYHLLLPISLLEPLERWISRLPRLAAFAQNVIYVCTPASAK